MTLFYPWPKGDGELLYGLRLLFGSAMVVSIVLGFAAIRRRDVPRHRALDAARLRDRAGRGHAGADPDGRGIDRRPAERAQPSAPDGRGLGDQPRRGRMDHPQAAGPSSPHGISRCFPSAILTRITIVQRSDKQMISSTIIEGAKPIDKEIEPLHLAGQ